MAHKRIAWKSWNELSDNYIHRLDQETIAILELMASQTEGLEGGENAYMPMSPIGHTIHTPLGVYPVESMFKPSDRWDCWMGTTNFGITQSIYDNLKTIDGIECLRILGKYTFFVGIPCTFSFRNVRIGIEQELCVYTEEEIMTGKTRLTVDLLKEQIQHSKYWSIFVGKENNIDYIVGDKLDTEYLEGLRRLDEAKQLLGGIILRGDNG